MGENRKKKPSSNSNNAAISNSKLRPKEAKVKKEELVETDDEDEKPISKRSSATKTTKPKKEESDDEDKKPISKRSSATKADKEKEMKKKKKKGEEKKAAAGKEVKREKKVYDLPGQKRDPPEERDPLRIFYETMYQQIPHSEMAQFCEYTPRLIKKLEGFRVKRVAAGLLHSTCIDETGSLFVFGDKVVANLGFGEAKNVTMPSMINTLPYSEEVACGGYHTCVVTSIAMRGDEVSTRNIKMDLIKLLSSLEPYGNVKVRLCSYIEESKVVASPQVLYDYGIIITFDPLPFDYNGHYHGHQAGKTEVSISVPPNSSRKFSCFLNSIIIFSAKDDKTYEFLPCLEIVNESKGIKWTYSKHFMGIPETRNTLYWTTCWNFRGDELEAGDHISLRVLSDLSVLEFGIDLIYDYELDGNPNVFSQLPWMSKCCKFLFVVFAYILSKTQKNLYRLQSLAKC